MRATRVLIALMALLMAGAPAVFAQSLGAAAVVDAYQRARAEGNVDAELLAQLINSGDEQK